MSVRCPLYVHFGSARRGCQSPALERSSEAAHAEEARKLETRVTELEAK